MYQSAMKVWCAQNNARVACVFHCLQILKNMQWGEFLWNRIISPLYLGACKAYNGDEDCARILAYTFYGASMFITPDDYFTISTGWPSSVSTRNLEHWAQVTG